MLLRMSMGFSACSTSKAGLEDANSGMEHWSERGSTHRKFQTIASRKTH